MPGHGAWAEELRRDAARLCAFATRCVLVISGASGESGCQAQWSQIFSIRLIIAPDGTRPLVSSRLTRPPPAPRRYL